MWPAAVATVHKTAPSRDMIPSLSDASRSRSSGMSRRPAELRAPGGVRAGEGPMSFAKDMSYNASQTLQKQQPSSAHDQNRSTSTMAFANAMGASCGTL